MNNVLILILY